MVVGYSVLNIFVESGTTNQPDKDDVASTVRWMHYECVYITCVCKQCCYKSSYGNNFYSVEKS